MLADGLENVGSGRLTQGIETDSSINSVVEFIEEHLSDFADKIKGETSISEKALTDKLCKFLNRKAGNYPFYFHHENVEDHSTGISPQTDIGTVSRSEHLTVGDRNYGEFDSFFSMEAKRLPTPGQNREKEYVIGYDKPNGGIERFKKGIHGRNLKYAAIIGYIQKDDLEFWFLKINDWIEELINLSNSKWFGEDKLNKIVEVSDNRYARLESNNLRIDVEPNIERIRLLHFWISIIN